MQFDIVIPVHKKDLQILEYAIKFARKNIIGTRRIITVSSHRYTNNAEWFSESQFPFTFDDIEKYLGNKSGWHFQQLLKMYAPVIIPGIAENVMILDSDTVFFKKITMFDKKNRPFYNLSKDKGVNLRPFDLRVEGHIKKLWPEIAKEKVPKYFHKYSGIAHNMMFSRKIMQDLFQKVEKYDGTGDKFWQIFLKTTDNTHGVSEYQIYFNFLTIFYRDQIVIRKLKYKNTADIDIKKYQRNKRYSYCSFHSYLRHKRKNSFKARFFRFFKNIYKSFFLIEQWNIGIAKCNISEFINVPSQEIHWLTPPKIDEFRADPFGYEKSGKKYIFFERYDWNRRKGEISRIDLDQNFNIKSQKTALKQDYHLSYPYIINDQVIPESHKSSKTSLYSIENDLKLAKNSTIISDLDIVDPSIIEHDGKFWLFYTRLRQGDDKLYLAYADRLDGNWTQHPQNPIKTDIKSARPGGQIFKHQGVIYRPAQNCLKSYGASLSFNIVRKLTTTEFAENQDVEITPNQLGEYPLGLHTISKLGEDLTLIDGKREVFVLKKPLIYLKRLILKLH